MMCIGRRPLASRRPSQHSSAPRDRDRLRARDENADLRIGLQAVERFTTVDKGADLVVSCRKELRNALQDDTARIDDDSTHGAIPRLAGPAAGHTTVVRSDLRFALLPENRRPGWHEESPGISIPTHLPYPRLCPADYFLIKTIMKGG
jgi:hypothetical protein